MTRVYVPTFGWLTYSEARYYGYRHSVHIGYWLFLWGQMTPDEIADDHDRRFWDQEHAYRRWARSERRKP